MLIRILFYKSKFGDGHILDNLISAYTGLFNWGTKNYSHCEIWVPDENDEFDLGHGCDGWMSADFLGTCYTSTMRGESNGVVKRPASEVLKNPGRWDWYEVEINEFWFNSMIMWMNDKVVENRGYDKPAIKKFFNPFPRESDWDRFICSEFGQGALFMAGVFGLIELLSPRRLSARLNKMGLKAKGVA